MAFIKKIWKDRISQFPNRRTINDGNVTKQVTVGRDEGAITEEGDAFDASNMNDLEQRIEDAYGDVAALVADEVANQYDSSNVIFDDEPDENHGTGYTVTSKGIKEAIDSGLVHTKTVSGSLVHIEDGADNIPVKSLVSQITAVESGSGEKSPTNPYTISGFDSGIITRCGKNLLSLNNVDFTLKSVRYYTSGGDFYLNGTSTGETSSKDTTFKNNLNFILKAGTYYFSRGNTGLATYLYDYYDDTKPAIVTNSGSFTLTEDTRVYIGFYVYNKTFNNLKSEIMLSVGSTSTDFEAYNGNNYTFTFGQTVFGGHFDNKGNAVVTHGYIASYNGETINEPWISSMDDYVPNTSPSTGAQVVYPLTTPTTLAITSQDIPTLLGENNIFSNCGDCEVTYYVDADAIYAIRDVIDEFAMQSDWNEADNTKADYIKNKPTIPANADFSLSGLSDTDISIPSVGQILTFDGDNWVNNSGASFLNNMLVVERKFEDVTFDTYYKSLEKDITKSGYTPIGVVGFQTNTVGAIFFRCNLSGNTLYIGLVARDGTTPITGTIATYVDVLYLKNS